LSYFYGMTVINQLPDRVLTLYELTAGIARVFSENFPAAVWVRAELTKLNHYPESGHCYPALVEKEKGVVKAEIRGTIWANDFLRINRQFLQITREPLKEGIHILFRAMVKYHPVYGLSLQISDIDPAYTLGEMAREKLETINRLKKEGLFDLNRTLPMPLLPQRVAVISVKTSKGFSDFISILENNAWGYAFSCALFPALLQGDKAVDSILGQLRRIKELKDHFDVVAIIRAMEVAQFPLPVLTGIGHSTNETVVEMVAGQNKITPTDVAYFLVQHFHNFSALVEEYERKILDYSLTLLESEKRRFTELAQRHLAGTRQFLQTEKSRMELLSRDLLALTKDSLQGERVRIGELRSGLKHYVKQWLAGRFTDVALLERQLGAIDPVNVLKRGYSITYFNGKPLRDQAEVKEGDEITTRLHTGSLQSEIKSKSK
jgi:exodeoxyribonuclease VII large subunit